MIDNPMCQAKDCPMAALCYNKTIIRRGSSNPDHELLCLSKQNFDYFSPRELKEGDVLLFHQAWAVAMSPVGIYYRFWRRKWPTMYNARMAHVIRTDRYSATPADITARFMLHISGRTGVDGAKELREDWFPTLEDLLANDWVVTRR